MAHLIFPDDVQTIAAGEEEPSGPKGRIASDEITPPAADLDRAVDLLAGAKRPVIIAGYGARDAMEDVISLAERLGAPVITTFKAKGQIPDDHPLACGVLGRSGTPVASWVMNEADMLLVLGASFSNHTGIYAGHPIVQVDFDRMQLGKFHPVTVPVWGEVGTTCRLIEPELERRGTPATDQRGDVADRRAIWAAEKASREGDDRGHGVNSASVFATLNRLVPEDAVIAVDVGNHAYSFGRYFETRGSQRVLMSGYLGLDRLRLSRRDGRLGGDRRGAPDRRRHRRRRLRPVHGRDHDGGQARHADLPRPAQQRPARQDKQGAARRRVGRVADEPAQPRLLEVRRALRRARDQGGATATTSTTRSLAPSSTMGHHWSRS